jgi:(1->4)-alpha-D-glucan 1-alpha-D-glucosylmutase
VLSEVPREWEGHLARWRRLNKRLKTAVKGRMSPDTNTEYLLYQTLVGLWPTPRSNRRADDLPDDAWLAGAAERLERYMMKAVKEAKTHTSWTDPDEEYEQSVKRFVHAILDTKADSPFLHDVARFVYTIARAGLWNSLARVLLHYTVPGTPDTYQGDELWTHTLVDPDNRQPVNYEHRLAYLAELALRDKQDDGPNGIVRDLARAPEDPRLKLLVVRQTLHARRSLPALFSEGDYVPLAATGSCANHAFAFARRKGASAAVTIVPRRTMTLLRGERQQATGDAWADTQIVLPDNLPATTWRSALTGREAHVEQDERGGVLRLADLLSDLPIDLLISAPG